MGEGEEASGKKNLSGKLLLFQEPGILVSH